MDGDHLVSLTVQAVAVLRALCPLTGGLPLALSENRFADR